MSTSSQEHDAAAAATHLFPHGRLSYVQIPALDVRASGAFYQAVFGWVMRGGPPHHLAFMDSIGAVLGAFVTDRTPVSEGGALLYIYVQGIDRALEQIVAAGGTVEREVFPEGSLWVATFRDPAGNLLGVWQQGPGR